MAQERFSSLALLHARRDFPLDLDAVLDQFARRHPRRMQLVNIIHDDPEQHSQEENADPRADLMSLK
jgi:hypothetical protein